MSQGRLAYFLRLAAEEADTEASCETGTERPRLAGLSDILEAEARIATQKAGGLYAPIVRAG